MIHLIPAHDPVAFRIPALEARVRSWRWALLLWLLSFSPSFHGAVSYRNEVIPVLSRAGCSMGACHGNANGKGGFKMSLRNEEPEADHRVLTRDFSGRRIDRIEPASSLLLRKATARQAHEGGQRFSETSREYRILHDWIREGAMDDGDRAVAAVGLNVTPGDIILPEPSSEVQLMVRARFADGTESDVTGLAWFQTDNLNVTVEPTGRVRREKWGESVVLARYLHLQVPVRIAFVPARSNYVWKAAPALNFIDDLMDRRLREMRMIPSELCSDTEFVRRAHLDLLGVLPDIDSARRFVEDPSPAKRMHLVEQLLDRTEFADHWAMKWGDLLRNEEKSLDPRGVQLFHRWMRDAFRSRMPMDQFARAILTGRGSTYESPPANFYRALREPLSRAESVAQVFLGTRLQCAKCHNHPFDRWTQSDYYDWADVFSQLRYRVLENRPLDGLDKHEFNGEQVVWMESGSHLTNVKTGKPAQARFLGSAAVVSEEDRLEALAAWMTDPTNPWFAKVQVNRVWSQLMGRGLVDSVDDFRATNPGVHPELLAALADDFVKHGYDLRHTLKRIMSSRTYQLSAVPNSTNQEDETHFSRATVRRLAAEPLLDSVSQVLGVKPRFRGQPAGLRAGEIPGGQRNPRGGGMPADRFLAVFGKPERLLTCDCERSEGTTMGQALQLVSGPTVNELIARSDNRLGTWLQSGVAPDRWVEELYWWALSRPPSDEERQRALKAFGTAEAGEGAKRSRAALEDLAWALLNSKEFIFRK